MTAMCLDFGLHSGTCDQSRHRILPFDDASPGIGLVQVQDEAGVWGLVCDDKWDDIDATVLCSCLGFNRYVAYNSLADSCDSTPSQQWGRSVSIRQQNNFLMLMIRDVNTGFLGKTGFRFY